LEVFYEKDPIRNNIIKSLPGLMEDTSAKKDWNWSPKIDKAKKYSTEMIKQISSISF
jgi:hypothetical protein